MSLLLCGNAAMAEEPLVVEVRELAKMYGESVEIVNQTPINPPETEFDKKYKGKTVIVEAVVQLAKTRPGPMIMGQPSKSYVVFQGYDAGGNIAKKIILRTEATAEFEKVEVGDLVRIRGTIDGVKYAQ
ncbi:MAG: hypothetical protein ACRCZF_02280, partial [Gemmataceae bacterium]